MSNESYEEYCSNKESLSPRPSGVDRNSTNPIDNPASNLDEDLKDSGWPKPKPFTDNLRAIDSFDVGLLADSLGPWIADMSHRMQCPIDYPAVGVMVCLSSIIGRKLGIHPKELDDWCVTCNLWGMIIGPPSAMKTPPLTELMRPLDQLEEDAEIPFNNAMIEYKSSIALQDIEAKKARQDAEKLNAKGEQKQAKEILLAANDGEITTPTRKRYKTNDPTVEKLGELLNENPNGLLVFRDELYGFLRNLDRKGHENDRAFYLEGFNGTGSYTYDRIGRGTIHIKAVTVSILGGIQPSRLRDYVISATNGGAGDDGLIQRFQLAAYPDTTEKWKYVDKKPDTQAKARAYRVIECLAKWNPSNNEEGVILGIRFAPDAQEVFIDWLTAHELWLRKCGLHPALEAHLAKFRSLIPSLALIIYLAGLADRGGLCNHKDMAVTKDALIKAIAWGKYLQSHAERIYNMGTNASTTNAKTILAHLEDGNLQPPFTVYEIKRNHWVGLNDNDEVEEAINLLIERGYVRAFKAVGNGRPTIRYIAYPGF